MMSQTNHTIRNSSQAGVTLMLALIILSSVLAISFSLATILLVEVKTSGDLARTEPALYGAQSVTEEALFKIRRQANETQFPGYSSSVNNVSLQNQANDYTDPIVQVKVPTNSKIKYSMHDPLDLTGEGNYSQITLTYLPTGSTAPVDVFICEVDPSASPGSVNETCDNLSESNPLMIEANTALRPALLTKTWTLNTARQYELILQNNSTSADLYVKIEPYGPNNQTRKGLPYFAETAVDINADLGGVSRSVRVKIPNSAPSAGAPAAPIVQVNGTATARDENNSPGNEKPPKAADGNDSTKWLEFKSGGTPFWWQLDFGAGVAWKIHRYSITTANDATERDPKTWTLLASNTGAFSGEQVVIDTISDGALPSGRGVTTEFTIATPPTTAYRYYRFSISDLKNLAAANSTQVGEFRMYGN